MTEGQSGSDFESYKNNIIEMIAIDKIEMVIDIISQSHQFCNKLGRFGIHDGRFILSDLSNGVLEVVSCSSTLLASSEPDGLLPSSTVSDIVASYPYVRMISRAPTLDDIALVIISLELVIEDYAVMRPCRYHPRVTLAAVIISLTKSPRRLCRVKYRTVLGMLNQRIIHPLSVPYRMGLDLSFLPSL